MIIAEGVTKEMQNRTRQKLADWDRVIDQKWLEEGTEKQKTEVYTMLSDPTVYGYAFFKNPRDLKRKFELYCYQDLIINDNHRHILFVAANQIGKSITLCLKALMFALHHPGSTTLMVSKTLPQSKDLLRQIKGFLEHSTLEYSYEVIDTEGLMEFNKGKRSSNKTEIYFRHYEIEKVWDDKLQKEFEVVKELPQSRIICVPATEAALGYAADLLLIDEIAFFEGGEWLFDQILQPRTYFTKGQIIVFSNPNGQQGIFWRLYNDLRFHVYIFNFLDCPSNTQEEFDGFCAGLTREQIDSTLLAKFTDPEGGFMTLSERKDMQKERENMIPAVLTTPVFIFFDWAKTMDRTVRVIGMPIRKGEKDWADEVFVLEMKEYAKDTPYDQIIDGDLKQLVLNLGINKVAMVGWDNTGVGKGLEDFIVRINQLGIMTQPVEFSLENKSRIYTLFKLLAEQRRITVPYIKECDKQLSMLRFKKSTTGKLMVHHESEKDRDDYPDALAGLCSLMISPENPPISVTII